MVNTKTRKPKYWGSWKGRVLKAIVINGAKTWLEIRDLTGLSEDSLNVALSELYTAGVLEKNPDGTYWVKHDTYREYKEFFERLRTSLKGMITDLYMAVKFSDEKQKELINWINQWRKVKRLDFSLENKHFFLEGRYLDDISGELISHAKSEVLVVNPFVQSCDLSNLLRDVSKQGVEVTLITHRPNKEDREKYHRYMKNDGITINYNKSAHAKLITVDRAVAVVSSMNFYSGSSGGAQWEAGIISVEEKVVESIVDSILRLLEKPESIEME